MAGMFYSLQEAAEKLKKTEEELKRLVRQGKLREFRDGPHLLFKIDEVEALMADTGIMAAKEPSPPEAPELELPEMEIPEMETAEPQAPQFETPEAEISEAEIPELETPERLRRGTPISMRTWRASWVVKASSHSTTGIEI